MEGHVNITVGALEGELPLHGARRSDVTHRG
jgi:hypothetical protein